MSSSWPRPGDPSSQVGFREDAEPIRVSSHKNERLTWLAHDSPDRLQPTIVKLSRRYPPLRRWVVSDTR